MKQKICLLIIVLLVCFSLAIGCTSSTRTTSSTPTPASKSSQISPSSTEQGAAITGDPIITGSSVNIEYNRGEDVIIQGNVQRGTAKSVIITTYYVCPKDAPNCPDPKSLRSTVGVIDKKVIPINADSTFSSNIGTSAYKQGMHVAFLELPTGKYTTVLFIIN